MQQNKKMFSKSEHRALCIAHLLGAQVVCAAVGVRLFCVCVRMWLLTRDDEWRVNDWPLLLRAGRLIEAREVCGCESINEDLCDLHDDWRDLISLVTRLMGVWIKKTPRAATSKVPPLAHT